MGKFIPYNKLSKKEKRKIDLRKRRQWSDYGMSALSNIVPNKRKQSNKYSCRKTTINNMEVYGEVE